MRQSLALARCSACVDFVCAAVNEATFVNTPLTVTALLYALALGDRM